MRRFLACAFYKTSTYFDQEPRNDAHNPPMVKAPPAEMPKIAAVPAISPVYNQAQTKNKTNQIAHLALRMSAPK